jgi:hypothetical protein
MTKTEVSLMQGVLTSLINPPRNSKNSVKSNKVNDDVDRKQTEDE